MNPSDINLLRDAAIVYEEHDKYHAYSLVSLATKYRPRGAALRKQRRRLWRQIAWLILTGKVSPTADYNFLLLFHPLTWFPISVRSHKDKLREKDVSILLKIASCMECTTPILAYSLYRLLATSDYSGIAERKEIELRPPFGGHMLTSRSDGTTERLNAIILGCLLAKESDLKFNFSWAQDTPAIANGLCSVSNDLPKLFSENFIEKYFLEFNKIREFRLSGVPVPQCEFVSGERIRTPFYDIERAKILEKSSNVVPHVRLPQGDIKKQQEDITLIVNEMFSSTYLDQLQENCQRFESSLGIHYRGGDVIYGMHRHGIHAIGPKSAPMPIIEDLIKSHRNERVILFGTPVGDTLDDMRYLEKKFSNLELSLDLSRSDMDDVVQDSMMMACCKRLIAFDGTGVSYLGRLFNPNLDMRSFYDIYSKQEFFQLCYDNRDNGDYNRLQLSYINVRALSLGIEMDISNDLQKELHSNIKLLDPDNRLDWANASGRLKNLPL